MSEAKEVKDSTVKGQRDRSPAYPFISLGASIERLIAFEKYFGRHSAPADKAGLAWDMKEKSSQAAQTLAALKYFGLVEYEGAGDQRAANLTEDGRNFLRAQQESIKKEILRRCALKPPQIAAYWEKWGADRPPDPICLDELVLKGRYTESAAKTFLSVYDDTIAYAGLSISGKSAENDSAHESRFKVGDFVQWESGGMLQFTEPRRVTRLSADGQFVFAEGSETGLPINEVKLMEVKARGEMPPPPPPIHAQAGFSQDVYTLGEEGKVILQWPDKISQESYEELSDWIELQLKKIVRLNKLKPKDK